MNRVSFIHHALPGPAVASELERAVRRYFNAGDRVLEEIDDSNAKLARYTTENDSYYGTWLHLQRATGESRFPLYDGIGTVCGLADAVGNVTDLYTLDTFGNLRSSTGTTPNPYRFGGAWGYITDTPGSGLLQLGQRYYWPEIGRFLQQDPIGDGMNWYAYVGNNPITKIDPLGLADVFVGFDVDLVGITGFEGGFGLVVDTDHPLESEVFGTAGLPVGANAGVAFGAGFAVRDMEGYSLNADVNVLGASLVASADDRGFNGAALSIGPGVGASGSFTKTETYTVGTAIDDLKSLYQDVKDIIRWAKRLPCPETSGAGGGGGCR